MTNTADDEHQMPERNGAGPGRPTLYTEELGNRICELLCEGKTLTRICKEHADLPSDRTVRRWALDAEHPFSPQYAHARLIGYHKMADETVDISDDGQNDVTTADGKTVVNTDVIARSRLRVDTRKWLLSKALPKIYGEKLELSGNINHTHEDRLREIEEMERAAAGVTDRGAAGDATRH